MAELKFAKGLSLPDNAATQKFAFLGRSSSGKSYAAKRLVESLVRAGSQVIVLDSVGIWYGLRSGALPLDIPILGGLHGDVALDQSMGTAVANLACDHATSLVLDVSQMIDADRTRFATAFARRFYERMKGAPRVITLVLEECQEYIAQEPQAGEQMMLHEFQRIAKIGRNFGIGLVLISQRPQEINKKALNQAEVVVAFQMTGPQERKALTYWLSDRGVDAGLPLDKTLPTLEVGKPFIWSPQWLKVARIVEVLPIETGDTSRTPTVGGGTLAPPKLSIIDAANLLTEMKAAIEKAQEDDPKFLRARIAELEKRAPVAAAVTFDKVRAEQLVLRAGKKRADYVKHIERSLEKLRDIKQDCEILLDILHVISADANAETLGVDLEEFFDGIEKAPAVAKAADTPRAPRPVRTETPRVITKETKSAMPPNGSTLPTGDAAVLAAAFQYGARGAPLAAVALMTGYKTRSIQNYIVRLRAHPSGPLVERLEGRLLITAQGQKLVPASTKRFPRGKALIEHLIRTLPTGESKILALALQMHPVPTTNEEIIAATGYGTRSVQNYVVHLVSRLAIKRAGPGRIKIHPEALS